MTSVSRSEPRIPVRALGLLGIMGGAVLLAAFLPVVIPSSVNELRLILFNLGAIAVDHPTIEPTAEPGERRPRLPFPGQPGHGVIQTTDQGRRVRPLDGRSVRSITG